MFGSPETTPGGRSLKFYSSVRIDIRRIESIKDGQTFIGNRVRCKVVKNKVAPPFRQAEFEIMFTHNLHGINRWSDVLDLAVEHNVVKKAGAFFSYGDLRLGQGKRNASTFLQENNDLFEEIDNQVREITGITQSAEHLDNIDLANDLSSELDSNNLLTEEAPALLNSTD